MILTMTTIAGENCTRGRLIAGTQSFFTIEQPWNNNENDTSCVPAGSYELIPYISPKHGITYCLHNPLLNVYGQVPMQQLPQGARTYCEIHSANWARQLKGCIALGLNDQPLFDPATGEPTDAVDQSQNALHEFLNIIGANNFGHILNITRNTEST